MSPVDLVDIAPLPTGAGGAMAPAYAIERAASGGDDLAAQVVAEPVQLVVAALDQRCGGSTCRVQQLDKSRRKTLVRHALLPHLHKGFEERRCSAVGGVTIVPSGHRVAQQHYVGVS